MAHAAAVGAERPRAVGVVLGDEPVRGVHGVVLDEQPLPVEAPVRREVRGVRRGEHVQAPDDPLRVQRALRVLAERADHGAEARVQVQAAPGVQVLPAARAAGPQEGRREVVQPADQLVVLPAHERRHAVVAARRPDVARLAAHAHDQLLQVGRRHAVRRHADEVRDDVQGTARRRRAQRAGEADDDQLERRVPAAGLLHPSDRLRQARADPVGGDVALGVRLRAEADAEDAVAGDDEDGDRVLGRPEAQDPARDVPHVDDALSRRAGEAGQRDLQHPKVARVVAEAGEDRPELGRVHLLAGRQLADAHASVGVDGRPLEEELAAVGVAGGVQVRARRVAAGHRVREVDDVGDERDAVPDVPQERRDVRRRDRHQGPDGRAGAEERAVRARQEVVHAQGALAALRVRGRRVDDGVELVDDEDAVADPPGRQGLEQRRQAVVLRLDKDHGPALEEAGQLVRLGEEPGHVLVPGQVRDGQLVVDGEERADLAGDLVDAADVAAARDDDRARPGREAVDDAERRDARRLFALLRAHLDVAGRAAGKDRELLLEVPELRLVGEARRLCRVVRVPEATAQRGRGVRLRGRAALAQERLEPPSLLVAGLVQDAGGPLAENGRHLSLLLVDG